MSVGDSRELLRLLDNRWIVTIQRSVDGRYHAFARKPYRQKVEDVLPKVAFEEDMTTGELQLVRKSDGIPCQNASGDTPDEALYMLAQSVFGLKVNGDDSLD